MLDNPTAWRDNISDINHYGTTTMNDYRKLPDVFDAEDVYDVDFDEHAGGALGGFQIFDPDDDARTLTDALAESDAELKRMIARMERGQTID